MTDAPDLANQELAALFQPPLRCGWEFLAPPPVVLSPERQNPPRARAPKTMPRYRAAGLQLAAIIVSVAAVAVIWIDVSFLSLPSSNPLSLVVIPAHLGAAAAAFWATRAWRQAQFGPPPGPLFIVWPLIAGLVTFFIPYIALPLGALVAWSRVLKGGADVIADPKDALKVESEYQEAVSNWQSRISQFENAEEKRFNSVDVWFPIGPSPAVRTVCAFGGSEISWAAALTTFGSSLLGSGARVAVVDLSRRRSISVLYRVAQEHGIPAAQTIAPADPYLGGLLANLTWNDLSTVIVETLHTSHESVDTHRQERQDDRAIIREVAGCLDPSGVVSFARLRSALLVVAGARLSPSEAGMNAREYDSLAELYNQVQRDHGGVMERVTRIERVLRDFAPLTPTGEGTPARSLLATREARNDTSKGQLQVISIDKRIADLDHDRLTDLLFQLLALRVRSGGVGADALFVLGADRLRRAALEALVQSAAHEGLRLSLFFEHLREDAIQIVGSGGGAAAIFALGNHLEAKEASDFIGANYKWVESQHSRSEGETLQRTWGVDASEQSGMSQGLGLMGDSSASTSRSMGMSYGSTFGKSTDYSISEQRVREAVVDPEVIQGLPITGMIWVETREKGQRVIANVDCHPQITFSPRVATQPRALPARG